MGHVSFHSSYEVSSVVVPFVDIAPSQWVEVFNQELLRYKNIEELVAMLYVELACVVPQPKKRPTMMEVVKMIEGYKGGIVLMSDQNLTIW